MTALESGGDGGDAPDPTLRPDAIRPSPVPDHDDLPADLRARIAEEAARAGSVPNVFAALAYAPAHLRGFLAHYDAPAGDAALARREIEAVIVAVSGTNDRYYRRVAHRALLRLYADDTHLADHRTADLDERTRAVLDVAVALTERPNDVREADPERLRAVGLSERAVWDVGAVTAFFNLSNRLASFLDLRPNEQFHAMGR
jgi:uncharacterized peroxidase-related enzyme